jgi:cytochrome P450
MISSLFSLFTSMVFLFVIRPAELSLELMGINWKPWRSNNQKMPPRTNGRIHAHPPEPRRLTELEEFRGRIDSSLAQMGNLLKAMKAPLPKTGNGAPIVPEKKTGITNAVKTVLRDLSSMGINTMEKVAKMGLMLKAGEDIDDKEYLMEYMIQAAAKLPSDIVGAKLTDDFVTTLWDDLSHPPEQFMDDKHQYRTADGSNNSYLHPQLGAAHEPYARTVKPSSVQSGQLPDAGVLFDTLMAREQAEEHPNRISSMLFYLASIIIHDLFKTNHQDFRISDTSSYLDLSPLYGSDGAEQKRMRTFKDGKIHPDSFSETRLLSFPPGVGTLLIMFNRFHNYVVEQLALINEGNRFTAPSESLPADRKQAALKKYDNDLFQTGRLITSGLYINIILVDYVRTILNLNRTDENWQLNPRIDIDGTAIATGNQVSAEFNLVYRWHSAVSDRDDKWTQNLFAELFNGKSPDEISETEFLKQLAHMQMATEKLEPPERDFHHLQRLENGKFDDTVLANILIESIEDCANAFGPRQVPAIFKQVEILGIRQARAWNLATLNEFRQHFSLKPYSKFSEITKNKEVASMLEHLYDTPDAVELYPGLVVEDAKEPKLPGSGLCPSFTTSRAVLSDAVALVRGDRFYTNSYHPRALTNWGFTEQNFDTNVDNGCVFYKLILRAFPNNFEPTSVYAHYPLTVPDETRTVLIDLKKANKYTFERPGTTPAVKMVFSHAAATRITEDQEAFKVTWGKAIEFLMGPASKNFMLAGDGKANAESRKFMENAMYMGPYSRSIPQGNEKWLQEVRKFYEEITPKLLKQKSFKVGKVNQVDIIRDVGNMAHVHFCAEMFSLPLKTQEYPHGIFTEYQMYLIMAGVFICVFFDVDPPHSFPLRQAAHEATQQLGKIVQLEVKAIKATGNFTDFMQRVMHPSKSPLKDYGFHMIHRLLDSGKDVNDIVWGNVMGTAGGMVANQGQLFGQVLDYLFSSPGNQYRSTIHKLAKADTPEADDLLMRYVLEFSRLNGETGVTRDVAKATTIKDGTQTINFKPGDRVLVNFKSASRDPLVFPDPDNVVLNRPLDSYIHLGHGPHQCLGLPMVRVTLTAMLKSIFKLDGLEPAPVWPGPKSAVKKVMNKFGDDDTRPDSWHYHSFMTEDWDSYFPFPTSLKVQFKDGAL